jgi:hypothetical protein
LQKTHLNTLTPDNGDLLMAYKYSGRIIRAGKAWTDNDGIRHPSSWMRWSDEHKATMGLVWEDDPAPFDNRFYWSAGVPRALDDVNEVDEDGNAILDENNVQVVSLGLKSQYKTKTKTTAASLLAPTDWQVIKAAEVADYTVPANITTYRAAVRTASNTIEAAIDGAADLDAFIALFDAPVDSDGVLTGNAPMNNWPDEVN